MEAFGEYAHIYDALNQDKDYEKEGLEIANLIEKYSSKKDMLMLGCGTGKHDRQLAKYGYSIHGVDMSVGMIEEAVKNKAGYPLSYEVGDIREFCSEKKYSIILSLFHVISYQTRNEDLVKTFQNVSNTLTSEDEIFIFDAWYGVGVLRDLPSIREKKVETDSFYITRIAEPEMHLDKNIVDVNYKIMVEDKKTGKKQDIQEKHVMRYLFTPEIEFLLEQCGLQLIRCIDCKTLKEPTFDTWTAYFIVKKK